MTQPISNAEIQTTEAPEFPGRNDTIKAIRTALKRRSGKTWSVTGGRGTAWGWITIDAPPARCTSHCQLKAGAVSEGPQDYEHVNTGKPGGSMTDTDRADLCRLLGLESVHFQGVSIAASHAYYREYLDRAEGRTPSKIAEPYWD